MFRINLKVALNRHETNALSLYQAQRVLKNFNLEFDIFFILKNSIETMSQQTLMFMNQF